MKTKSILLLSLAALGFTVTAQDDFFLNTNQSLVLLNPSYAGSNGLIRNQTAFRNFFPTLPSRSVTYANTVDGYVAGINGGLALSFLTHDDWHGILRTDHLALSYAQYFYLSNKQIKIVPSIQFDYTIKKLDRSNLTFGSPFMPGPNIPQPKTIFLDINTGLLIYYKNFNFGATVFHANQPDEGLSGASRLPFRLSLHSSYTKIVSDETMFQFLARYNNQAGYDNIQIGANQVFFKHLLTGVGLTCDWTALYYANIGYRSNYFSTIFSYGQNFSAYHGYDNFWELMLNFNLRNKERRKVLTSFEEW